MVGRECDPLAAVVVVVVVGPSSLLVDKPFEPPSLLVVEHMGCNLLDILAE